MQSPFLNPDVTTKDNQLTILHIRRDQSIPTLLAGQANPELNTGYAEGVVTNTRFGSYPHSTLVDLPWGSQVRASLVDTGSRGRKYPPASPAATGHKRRAGNAIGNDDDDDDVDDGDGDGDAGRQQFKQREAVAASSGFIHVLPPTPENWTTSLYHRTQVVYTPDYSFILHRLRARPGGVLIEAGSGSGSFTHAAARAVYHGEHAPGQGRSSNGEVLQPDGRKIGQVFSYEFHADRYAKVRDEIGQHGLDSVVTVVERDVYHDGFLVKRAGSEKAFSPMANAVFLDLPAPWLALPHLTRQSSADHPTPLDAQRSVSICTFSPCVEQAQKTVSALRRYGWIDIEMVEIQQKRIEVRRDFTGYRYEGMRGVNAVAVDVDEALGRLEEVEQRSKDYNAARSGSSQPKIAKPSISAKALEAQKALSNGGRLVHRDEPELKAHTSYLVFAILPRDWSEEDEAKARAQWAGRVDRQGARGSQSHRQMKREAKRRGEEQKMTREAGGEPFPSTAISLGEADEALDDISREEVVEEQ